MAIEVALELEADERGLVTGIRISREELGKLTRSVQGVAAAGTVGGKTLEQLGRRADTTARKSRNLRRELTGVKTTLASLGALAVAREITQTGNAFVGYESALTAVKGTQEEAREEIEFTIAEARRLGLNLNTLTKQYTLLQASVKETSLEGQLSRDIFQGLSESATVLRLSNADLGGVMNAVNQIISKQVVSAEELRQQLAERLPGAFQSTARALGITTKELNDQLAAGELLAEDVLPKLAQELRNQAAAGLEVSRNSPVSEMERLRTELTLLSKEIAESGFLELLADGSREAAELVRFLTDNVDDLQRTALIAAAAVGGVLAGRGIASVLVALRPTIAGVNRFGIGLVALNTRLAATELFAKRAGLALRFFGGVPGLVLGAGAALLTFGLNARESSVDVEELDQRVLSLLGNMDALKQRELQSTIDDVQTQISVSAQQLAELQRQIAVLESVDPNLSIKEGGIIDQAGQLATAREEFDRISESVQEYSGQLAELGKRLSQVGESSKKGVGQVAEDADEAAKKAKKLADAQERLQRIFISSIASVEPLTALNAQYKLDLQEIAELAKLVGAESQLVTQAQAALAAQLANAREELRKSSPEYQRFIDGLERADETLRDNQEAIADLIDELFPYSAASRDAQLATELLNQANREGYISDLQRAEGIRIINERLRESVGLFGQGRNSFAELLGDSLEASLQERSASAFFDGIKDGFKEAFKDGFSEAAAAAVNDTAQFAAFAVDQFRRDDITDVAAITNVAAQIPGIVGEIAQAVQAVDSIFGGRLLGTRFETDSTGRNINFAGGQFSGNEFERQSRQRSFFRGTRRRTVTSELDSGTQSQLEQLQDQLAVAASEIAREFATTLAESVRGGLQEEFDKDGNLTRSDVTVNGRTFQDENAEDLGRRLLAETTIAQLALVSDEVDSVANRFRDSSQAVLEFSQFALAAQVDITRGNALLGESLTQLTEFTQAEAFASETLSQTYQRLVQATDSYSSALDLLDQEFAGSREAFISFAADISEAAGGVAQANQLWQSYFDTFFDADELLQARLRVAQTNAASELGDIGLNVGTSASQFRDLFEETLPTLSAEAVVEWLEAAQALGTVIELQGELNQIEADRAERLREINQAVTDASLSGFVLDMRDLRSEFSELRSEAQRLGATNSELARIDQLLAQRSADLLSAREAEAAALAADFNNAGLSAIQSQIAAIQQQNSAQLSSINQVAAANQRRYDEEVRAVQRVQDFLNSSLLSDVSPLNARERLDAAQSQFDSTLQAALAGDIDAKGEITQLAQQLLEERRAFDPSGFRSFFDGVQNQLSQIGVDSTEPPVVTAINNSSTQLRNLFAERDRLIAEQEGRRRLELAQDLSQAVSDLIAETGQPLADIAEQLGVNLGDLVQALGINLDELTNGTVDALQLLADSLGVTLADLATALGVEIVRQVDLVFNTVPGGVNNKPDTPVAQVDQLQLQTSISDQVNALEGIDGLLFDIKGNTKDSKNLLEQIRDNTSGGITVPQTAVLP